MKNFKLLIGFFALVSLLSCSDDDAVATIPTETLTDNWTLVTASGTIAGITHEFPHGTIVWKFNPNNTVTVVNNNTNENLQSGLASGTYTYTVSSNAENATCEKKITINNTAEFQCLIMTADEMDIDEGIADGVNYHFEKIIPFETN